RPLLDTGQKQIRFAWMCRKLQKVIELVVHLWKMFSDQKGGLFRVHPLFQSKQVQQWDQNKFIEQEEFHHHEHPEQYRTPERVNPQQILKGQCHDPKEQAQAQEQKCPLDQLPGIILFGKGLQTPEYVLVVVQNMIYLPPN